MKCPLCGGESAPHISADVTRNGIRFNMQWLKCAQCDHAFTGRALDCSAALTVQTAPSNDITIEQWTAYRGLWAQTFDGIKLDGAAVLDIGYRDGIALLVAREMGAKLAVGVDFNTRPAYLPDSIATHQGDAMEFLANDGRKYDLIIMADIVEHVIDPRYIVAMAGNRLVRYGKLIISMPLRDGVNDVLFHDRNPFWGEVEHCHYFTRSGLVDMVANCGFKLIRQRPSQR
jgi:2-polyprenyl-3-methyl-5-hydroxy-6-metoxy-1,4-benzoquinol methylase